MDDISDRASTELLATITKHVWRYLPDEIERQHLKPEDIFDCLGDKSETQSGNKNVYRIYTRQRNKNLRMRPAGVGLVAKVVLDWVISNPSARWFAPAACSAQPSTQAWKRSVYRLTRGTTSRVWPSWLTESQDRKVRVPEIGIPEQHKGETIIANVRPLRQLIGAINDEVRLGALGYLLKAEEEGQMRLSFTQLQKDLGGLESQNLSYHLKLLRQAGLVVQRGVPLEDKADAASGRRERSYYEITGLGKAIIGPFAGTTP